MRYLLALLAVLFLSACSPKYIIKTHYDTPVTKSGKRCVKKCDKRRISCQKKCDRNYNRCLNNARKKADRNLPMALNEYDREMQNYYNEMHIYDQEMRRHMDQRDQMNDEYLIYERRCSKQSDSKHEYCRRARTIRYDLRRLRYNEPDRPRRPVKPTLSTEVHKLQNTCSRKCGCTASYDTCFGSCGGILSYEKICIANCD